MSIRYPDPKNGIDPALYQSLRSLPFTSTREGIDGVDVPSSQQKIIDLTWVKENLDITAASFEIPQEHVIRGMQANMFKIVVKNTEGKSTNFVCKRIAPKELPDKKDPEIWKQFLRSVRREIQFYQMLKIDLASASDGDDGVSRLFPRVLHCSSTEPSMDDTDPMSTSFLIVMEDLGDYFYQAPALNLKQAQSSLQALAKFHCHFWERNNILDGVERGGFWVLARRKITGDLDSAEANWKALLERLPELRELGLVSLDNICSEVLRQAERWDNFVGERCHTLIHGDCKGWNLFLRNEEASKIQSEIKQRQPIILIDMQWCGKGHPLQDVAYLLTTSLDAALLPTSFDSLVDLYLEELSTRLAEKSVKVDVESMRKEFNVVWLDYTRVIVSSLWKNLSKERMKQYENTVGPSMINRSIEHVKFIIQRIHRLLFEEDREAIEKILIGAT